MRRALFAVVALALVLLSMASKCTGEAASSGTLYRCSCKRVCEGVTMPHTVSFRSQSGNPVTVAMANCMLDCPTAVCSQCTCTADPTPPADSVGNAVPAATPSQTAEEPTQ